MIKEQILKAYNQSRETYRELVGSLYPSIAYSNLMELRQRYIDAGGDASDLPFTPQPTDEGRVPYFKL